MIGGLLPGLLDAHGTRWCFDGVLCVAEARLDSGRRTALSIVAEHGRVQAVCMPDDAYTAMMAAWSDTAARLKDDIHDRIENPVVLAGCQTGGARRGQRLLEGHDARQGAVWC
ncbi:hypothetical protein [Streptomyces virginiae]|uniref:hypothetical protein n=1 Tax=Streptomyces virginiae TaxID=1961 RepID=UPI0035D9AA20